MIPKEKGLQALKLKNDIESRNKTQMLLIDYYESRIRWAK